MELYECHGHMVLDGADYRAALAAHKNGPDEGRVRACLEQYRRRGVRFFRDGGDKYGVSLLAARLAGAYGIDCRTPVFALHRQGLYGGMIGRAFADMASFRALADEVCASGGDYLKLVVTGIMDFTQYGVLSPGRLSAEEIREAVGYAHSLGLAVMAHVNGAEAVRDCLLAGVDSIEHGYYLDGDCLRLLVQSGAVWVPTLAPVLGQLGAGAFPDAVLRRILDGQLDAVRRAFALGCALAPGSDAGAGHVPHGEGIEREYAALLPCHPDAAALLESGAKEIASRFRAPGKRGTK